MDPVKVLVADDHPIVRRGIIDILSEQEELKVVGEARDGLEAVEKARKLAPDIVVMDLMMPNLSGLKATLLLQTEMPQLNVLILTISDKESDLFDAMKFGAKGYIVKNAEPDELVQAIIHTARGGVIVSPSMAAKLLSEFRARTEEELDEQSPSQLSKREEEVLQLVSQGASNKEIASSLSISENTVKTHLRNILEKLHLANRSQAAAYAVKAGLDRHQAD